MSARPFQVGDRVRITKHRVTAPDEINDGRVTELERIHPDNPITMWIRLDEPGTYAGGSPRHIASAYVTDDLTGSVYPTSATIELLEPAPEQDDDGTEAESLAEVSTPTDPVGALTGEVGTSSQAGLQAVKSAARPDLARLKARAALVNAATAWADSWGDATAPVSTPERALVQAVRDYWSVTP